MPLSEKSILTKMSKIKYLKNNRKEWEITQHTTGRALGLHKGDRGSIPSNTYDSPKPGVISKFRARARCEP